MKFSAARAELAGSLAKLDQATEIVLMRDFADTQRRLMYADGISPKQEIPRWKEIEAILNQARILAKELDVESHVEMIYEWRREDEENGM